MPKRYFEHVYTEISVAVGRRVSRYDLWLAMWSAGDDPEDLTLEQLRSFFDSEFEAFLREEGVVLDGPARRRLEKRMLRFNPNHPTPEEWFARSGRPHAQAFSPHSSQRPDRPNQEHVRKPLHSPGR